MARVIVYKNLRRGDWSIAESKGNGRGRVIDHRREVTLLDVMFYVSDSGRARVVRNQCREVHAWCIGDIADTAPASHGDRVAVTYNPYRSGSFTRRDNGATVDRADYVEFTASHGAIACNPGRFS